MSLKGHTNICVEKKRSTGITVWKAVQQWSGISPWSELLPCSCSLCPHSQPWAPLLSGVKKRFLILFFSVGAPKWRSRAVGGILVLLKSCGVFSWPFSGVKYWHRGRRKLWWSGVATVGWTYSACREHFVGMWLIKRLNCSIVGYMQGWGEEDPQSIYVALTLPLEKDWIIWSH